jgi:alginate O-acetyltransferase complex protein AlgI
VIFTTWIFAAFALVAIALYWSVVPQRLRSPYLALTGALFYAYAVPAYLALIVALAGLTYVASHAMLRVPQSRRRPALVLGVTALVATLGYFKYAHFIAAIVAQIARHDVLPLPNIIVPLAISFFTFEFIHVLVDTYDGKIARLGLLDFVTFALFFPTLVAGPIKRFEHFAPQLHPIAMPTGRAFTGALYRIALGVAKKLVVADSMNAFTGPILRPGFPYGHVDYLVAMLGYAAKIYFDFSGYSDIAIGVAGLFGIRVPENFDRPYGARDIAEFWRRWHMSLSSWVRDYVFIPLGGSRRSALVTALNLIAAMAIVGLWHGAAWTFVIWGLWHGVGLAVHRTWLANVVPRVALLRSESLVARGLSTATTFAFVTVGWVFFAATSLTDAGLVFRGLL